MKLSVLLLLGVLSVDATETGRSLVQTNVRSFNHVESSSSSSSSSDSDSDSANVQLGKPCEYLDETTDELNYQVDMFSRTLDPRHWQNALNINKALGEHHANQQRL